MDALVLDSITEWWIHPLASVLNNAYVYGAISSTGEILVCSVNPASRATIRTVVGSGVVDDHNAPALWTSSGRRSLIIWTQHNRDNLINFRVSSAAGSVSSWLTQQTVDLGGLASYAQIHHVDHLSTPGSDVFMVFSRVATLTWAFRLLTINQSTGAVTVGTQQTLVSATNQTYISTANDHSTGNQGIRVAWGYNPASAPSAVRYLHVDVVTGNVTSPVDPAVSGNIWTGTGLPLVDTATTPLLPAAPEDTSRRLFYPRPGPMPPAVLYAEWPKSDPDAAIYKKVALQDGSWVITEHGPAGPRFGYNENANYIAGASFPDPCTRDVFAVTRYVDGVSSASVVLNGHERVVARSTTSRVIRPVFPYGVDDRVIVSQPVHYGTSYTDYLAFSRTVLPGGRLKASTASGQSVDIW